MCAVDEWRAAGEWETRYIQGCTWQGGIKGYGGQRKGGPKNAGYKRQGSKAIVSQKESGLPVNRAVQPLCRSDCGGDDDGRGAAQQIRCRLLCMYRHAPSSGLHGQDDIAVTSLLYMGSSLSTTRALLGRESGSPACAPRPTRSDSHVWTHFDRSSAPKLVRPRI
ncbi:hypothetical protein CIHG_09249 [Coccidioides immitis H538.4]|uniref:Uncharacterized protein n=3 Tax=Coccidioides immitis TaxID=5501 RepID=A0A0J8R4G5_COCIT|nr:hypothetical protein CIRG_07781 [Coccidioides immitis RMSCC 2394]KMU79616.1 hypothetical protein CISG_02034 [Coccidioides immitis RMSCC 3703]KMU91497.1 hypothetical protein CIHG_09249 [Coccidioides immitis H538.4]